jgi:hypothetical protein
MKKKILVLVVVLLLFALTSQVAFADPPPDDPDNFGSCNMIASWWAPLPDGGPAPGNANGVRLMPVELEIEPDVFITVLVQRRGMAMAHFSGHPDWYTNGAIRMDEITVLHCG